MHYKASAVIGFIDLVHTDESENKLLDRLVCQPSKGNCSLFLLQESTVLKIEFVINVLQS